MYWKHIFTFCSLHNLIPFYEDNHLTIFCTHFPTLDTQTQLSNIIPEHIHWELISLFNHPKFGRTLLPCEETINQIGVLLKSQTKNYSITYRPHSLFIETDIKIKDARIKDIALLDPLIKYCVIEQPKLPISKEDCTNLKLDLFKIKTIDELLTYLNK